jgi:hypothetical protein
MTQSGHWFVMQKRAGSASIRRGRFRLNHLHRDLVRSIAAYPAYPPTP